MCALVTSRLDSSNCLLVGLQEDKIKKLQVVQNDAARVNVQANYNDHITETRKSLHWLPIRERLDYKVALFVYKALHGEAPSYIEDLITIYVPPRSLRSSNKYLLKPPESRPHLVYYGYRAFEHYAPSIWNSLGSEVRASNTTSDFKSKLKTFLFKRCYESG